MAELKIASNMKVKDLKDDFKKAFGASLRVYTTTNCKTPADDEATLGSLMAKEAKEEEVTFGSNLQVNNFEKKVAEKFGIGVQVANADNTKLANNAATLAAAGK